MLLIGNSAAKESASSWHGKIFEVAFWDHAFPDSIARAMTSSDSEQSGDPAPLASYKLSGSPPFQDQRHFLPDLALARDASTPPSAGGWLISRAPVTSLVSQIQRTNQFSLQVLCQPSSILAGNGRMVFIARLPGPVNLDLRQKNTDLTFWFRNAFSTKRPNLAWEVPDVFAPNQPRNLLLSYDGSRLSLYVDGKKDPRFYCLDPGTGLALPLQRVKSAEVAGYHYIFYAMVFFPAGCLLGVGWRKLASPAGSRLGLVFIGVLVPSVVFEITLAIAGGTSVWLGNIALSALLILSGIFWVNSDTQPPGIRKVHL
jgi:hypothetical protein